MTDLPRWRVGRHYGIHVYEGDRPVATFHREEDARRCIEVLAAVERAREVAEVWARADRYAPGIPEQYALAAAGRDLLRLLASDEKAPPVPEDDGEE